jgi:hypothetical protein
MRPGLALLHEEEHRRERGAEHRLPANMRPTPAAGGAHAPAAMSGRNQAMALRNGCRMTSSMSAGCVLASATPPMVTSTPANTSA